MSDTLHIASHQEAATLLAEVWPDSRFTLNNLLAPIDTAAYTLLLDQCDEKLGEEKNTRKSADSLFSSISKRIAREEEIAKFKRPLEQEDIKAAETALTFLREAGPVKARGPFSVVKDADAESMELVNSIDIGIAP